MENQNNPLVYALQFLDALIASILIAFLCFWYDVSFGAQYHLLVTFVFGLSFFTFWNAGIYVSWRGTRLYRECITIAKACIVLSGLLFFVLFITKTSTEFSRRVLLTWAVLTPMTVMAVHVAARLILRFLRRRGHDIKQGIIVGAGKAGLEFANFVSRNPWAGIRIAGYFDDRRKPRNGDVPAETLNVLGTFKELQGYLQDHHVDYIYLVLPLKAQERIEYVLSLARTGGAKVFLVPDMFSYYMQNARVQFFGDRMLLNFNPEQPMKRRFDIAFSFLVLLLTSPLFLLVALLIKLEDNGPVFYRHWRVTSTGKRFGCLKFRTMHVNADKKLQELLKTDPAIRAEWEKNFKLKKDPRVTRIGKFLRRTSLDELPQFWNVLVGDMSVVGARPVISKELYDYYRDHAGVYCSIKPGITGPWQVSGRSDIEDYQQRVTMDIDYILNRSMWIDIKIIMKTVMLIFTGKGAY